MGTETNKSSITLLIVSPLYVKKIIPLMGTKTGSFTSDFSATFLVAC